MKGFIRAVLITCSLLAAGATLEVVCESGTIVRNAEAIVGRPLTPISYAGVARRTVRRTIHRTTVYVATLPRGCTTVLMEGATLYHCGASYYQSYNNQYVIVNVY